MAIECRSSTALDVQTGAAIGSIGPACCRSTVRAASTRPIVLAPWQQAIVAEHPWPLIRGLIHSDGCRAVNNVVVRGKRYSYLRYFLSNESRDILRIAADALNRVGVEWRYNRPNSISIARREFVALMEQHVGPKV